MPTRQVNAGYQVTTRVAEVNPLRETLTVHNHNPYIGVLADHDAPRIGENRINGIPIFPYSVITLERETGDNPSRAWYFYCHTGNCILVVHEGMAPPRKRWW